MLEFEPEAMTEEGNVGGKNISDDSHFIGKRICEIIEKRKGEGQNRERE